MKKRMRKLEAARLAKHAAEDTSSARAAAAAAAAHGKAAKAAKATKVAKGAAPNAGLAAETEAEKSARATFENGADRQVRTFISASTRRALSSPEVVACGASCAALSPKRHGLLCASAPCTSSPTCNETCTTSRIRRRRPSN